MTAIAHRSNRAAASPTLTAIHRMFADFENQG